MNSLFQDSAPKGTPLADQLRPKTLEEYVGQHELVGDQSALRRALSQKQIPSMILWGPPGSGKTTLAHIVAGMADAHFVTLSATSSGKKELQDVIAEATRQRDFYQKKSIVFVDEIHRWNKAQQDALLPAVEKGVVILIGATTENPSFSVNSALLSRVQVFVLKQLSDDHMRTIIERAGQHIGVTIPKESVDLIVALSNGDARTALNTIDFLHQSQSDFSVDAIKQSIEKTAVYDKSGEEHYNLISALHKSMRASDPDAAVYWAARMLHSGEDPRYVTRRVVRFASEDIGNAKPNALVLALAAHEAAQQLGMPECNLAILQAVEYCARAPKSRAVDDAWSAVMADIESAPNEPVPMHLRNAPTTLMKKLGYGKREQESNLPANLAGKKYFADTEK